jgi:hypothetical protein
MSIYVYRLIDHRGTTLYVGATSELGARLRRHHQRKWGDRIHSLEAEMYPTWDTARDAERNAIYKYDPLFNEDLTGVARTTGRGELSARVLKALQAGPMTSVEVELAVLARGFKGGRNNVSSALIRLRDAGRVVRVGERPALSGRHKTAALYALPPGVADSAPPKRSRPRRKATT